MVVVGNDFWVKFNIVCVQLAFGLSIKYFVNVIYINSKQQWTNKLPWTTPLDNGNCLDIALPTRVQWDLLDRKLFIQLRRLPVIPQSVSLSKSLGWLTTISKQIILVDMICICLSINNMTNEHIYITLLVTGCVNSYCNMAESNVNKMSVWHVFYPKFCSTKNILNYMTSKMLSGD